MAGVGVYTVHAILMPFFFLLCMCSLALFSTEIPRRVQLMIGERNWAHLSLLK